MELYLFSNLVGSYGKSVGNSTKVPVDPMASMGPKWATNIPAGSYTWKRLGKPLNMEKTLAENGMEELVIDVGAVQFLGGSSEDEVSG